MRSPISNPLRTADDRVIPQEDVVADGHLTLLEVLDPDHTAADDEIPQPDVLAPRGVGPLGVVEQSVSVCARGAVVPKTSLVRALTDQGLGGPSIPPGP